jgi:leucyl aminopeptidase (aminopeptidase T)
VTSKALSHSRIFQQVQTTGKRWIAMHGVTPEMLSAGADIDDYRAMGEVGQRVEDAWSGAESVHVTSDLGTDFRANVKGRRGILVAGRMNYRPEMGLNICCFPDGEVAIAPLEGTGEGVVVFDTTIDHVGLLQEPITVVVKKGLIDSIAGGAQASALRDLLAAQNDPLVYNFPAEMSIGLNPRVHISGIMRSDKKLLGTMHMAMGTSIDIGGTVKAKVHLDGLIRKPKVVLDGKVIVDEGQILV